MDQQYIKLNERIKELLYSYDFDDNDIKLIFNFENFTTVSNAISKAYHDFKKSDDTEENDFLDLCYYVNDIMKLDPHDDDIFINIENYYNPKHLTVVELRRVYDQLNHVKK